MTAVQHTRLSDLDLHLFNEGSHCQLHEKLGSFPCVVDGTQGTHFAVWAPNAAKVAVSGPFNDWSNDAHPLQVRGSSGIWEGFVPGVGQGDLYKYHIRSRERGYAVDKADPFARRQERPPGTASVVWSAEHTWQDSDWMRARKSSNALEAPISIYEVHLGSWMHDPDDGGRRLTYREVAPKLADHVSRLGFTHVEFLPLTEHPFYGSWGYLVTGYFAPTSRFGAPEDLMFLVDTLHQRGIGVIFDWVPAHFPSDEHGLGYFDGTHLYEHADPRQGRHRDWGSLIFNYGRKEVQSFLTSSALFWLQQFHADGLRVDGVASMLYLDYSRPAGEWIPNEHGGNENLEAIALLRHINQAVYRDYPDVQTIAEESTSWPMVSRPVYLGGLGFGFKWDMGWMHDTLHYLQRDPVFRRYHQRELTFRQVYAFQENYVLALAHDEVVHGKGSLLGKMPGDEWRRFANLRLLLAYMYAQPGKKLLFMGGEFGAPREWNHQEGLDWQLAELPGHRGVQELVQRLNSVYRAEPALHTQDTDARGFEWIDASDTEHSTLSFLRHARDGKESIAVVLNCTPLPRHDYRIGVDVAGTWQELVNTDAVEYGGSGQGNFGQVEAAPVPWHGRTLSLNLTLPPLAAVFFKAPPGGEPPG